MKTFEIYINSTRNALIDFKATASRLGTSVSSVAWAVEEGNSITLDAPVLSNNIAQTSLVSQATAGCCLVRCVATMANGEKIPEYFKIKVVDPRC